jgi:hypothetical protein
VPPVDVAIEVEENLPEIEEAIVYVEEGFDQDVAAA